MIDFTEIHIKDKQLFDKYLVKFNTQASEFTFTNFFMWRALYKFRYAEIEGFLCVIASPENEEPYALTPIGNGDIEAFKRAVGALKGYFSAMGKETVFKKVPESELHRYSGLAEDVKGIFEDRDNSDYIYLTNDLINLKGKKFDGKRNHINRFKKEHVHEYQPLSAELAGECKRIMNDWCEARDCDCQRGGYCDKYANIEVLDNIESLGVKGALIKVDGRYEAFTIGELINADTAVIHIEKAKTSINGLFTFINQQFCEHEWEGTTYINREQDLGQEGLRKSKLSYNPVTLLKKFTIIL